MAIAFVGAGSGIERTTAGTSTVSKTGCTADNLIVVQAFFSGDSGDWSGGNWVNIEDFQGTPNDADSISNAGSRFVFVGRATADGTCSFDVTRVTDNYVARMYEFSGEIADSFPSSAGVFENINSETGFVTSTTITAPDVTTLGANRLAMCFVGVRSAQALTSFTGETGGDWTETVAEYQGTALTIQLQTAPIAAAGTITGGTQTISSAYWLCIGTALVPHIDQPTWGSHPRRGVAAVS